MNKTKGLVLAALFAALTAIGAFLKIPVGGMAITLQFFFTAMAGVLLGAKWGAISQAVYVLLGLVGLPIFTKGGGVGYLFEPSFGFLLGLIPSAAVIGLLCGDGKKPVRVFLACTAGLGVLYLVGMPYMYLILNVYMGLGKAMKSLLWSYMIIYLPGDFAKIIVTVLLARPLRKAVRRA